MESDNYQFDKLKKAARQSGMDDDPSRFNERLGKLVSNKPVPEKSE